MLSKFEKVANKLVERVENGTYTSSQKLPSEYDLAKEFEVSRLTVRKAIDLLINSRILVKDPRKGTYVMSNSSHSKIKSGLMGLQSFSEVAKINGRECRTEVLKFEKSVQVDDEIKTKLQLHDNPNPIVNRLVRRRFWDEEPMTVEDIFVLDQYIVGYQKEDFTQSLFQILLKSVDISYSQQEMEAMLANQYLAELLHVKIGDPIMWVCSITYTADSHPIFYDISYYRADKYTFRSTLTRQIR